MAKILINLSSGFKEMQNIIIVLDKDINYYDFNISKNKYKNIFV